MHMEKKWIIGVFSILALCMVIVLGVQFIRSTEKGNIQGGEQSVQDVASLKELAAALKEPEKRAAAIQSLREKQGEGTVDLLAALGYNSKDVEVRAAAMTALGELGDPRGLQVLTIGGREEQASVRIAAIRVELSGMMRALRVSI